MVWAGSSSRVLNTTSAKWDTVCVRLSVRACVREGFASDQGFVYLPTCFLKAFGRRSIFRGFLPK
jgi:hypothetical protein